MKEIRDALKKFQEGYDKRDVNLIDTYMNDLFVSRDDILTVGTSRSEWCFGVSELKNLIESDWQWWGNLSLDLEKAKFDSSGDTAWFLVNSSITWDEEEDFAEWCDDLISDYYSQDGRFVNFDDKSKMGMMNLKLSFLVKSAKEKKGANIPYPVRIFGRLVKQSDKWLIDKLHFSMPMSSYPEWRVDLNNSDSLKYYNQIKDKMAEFNKKYPCEHKSDVDEVLTSLEANYLNKTTEAHDVLTNLFIDSENIYLLDPNEVPVSVGTKNLQNMILTQRNKWDEMTLNISEAIVDVNDNVASVTTNGLFKKRFDSNQFVSNQMEIAKNTLASEGDGLQRLFEVQKQFAYAFKEISFGEEANWEFRFEATLIKQNNEWKFHNVLFTYPSLYVFEGNYNMTPLF